MSKVARFAVQTLLMANILLAGFLVIAIVLSFPFADAIASRLVLKYGSGVAVAEVTLAGRLLLVLGVVAAAVLHRIFAGLLAILATVRDGDPFIAANARRLRAIGWALLAFQLLDLVLGAFTAWVNALGVEFSSWSPAFGGWVAVLLTFVLASVFERGAAMRDDLATTI